MLSQPPHVFDVTFGELKLQVKKFLEYDGGGHDYLHAERVFNVALHICGILWWDELIVWSASLVHDICRPWEKQTGKSHFGPEALEIISGVLDAVAWYTPMQKEAILEIVKLHDMYDWNTSMAKTLELQIVQDADNLDAIGAIGIGRAFAFGWAHGSLMYIPDENLHYDSAYEERVREERTTIIWHFYEKLLKLAMYMNTSVGKEIAQKRHEFMETYLEQFFAEWKGER